jgi:uncharacterized protein (DUF983 family)
MTTDQEVGLAIIAAFAIVGLFTLIGGYLIVGMAWQEFAASHEKSGGRRRPLPSGWSLLWRALARKCPHCGRGGLFSSYFTMRSACPECGAVYWKNQGEWIGPMVIDYAFAVAAAMVTWALLVFCGYSVTVQTALPCLVAVAGAVAIVPWSRSFWTAFLYLSGEITTPG